MLLLGSGHLLPHGLFHAIPSSPAPPCWTCGCPAPWWAVAFLRCWDRCPELSLSCAWTFTMPKLPPHPPPGSLSWAHLDVLSQGPPLLKLTFCPPPRPLCRLGACVPLHSSYWRLACCPGSPCLPTSEAKLLPVFGLTKASASVSSPACPHSLCSLSAWGASVRPRLLFLTGSAPPSSTSLPSQCKLLGLRVLPGRQGPAMQVLPGGVSALRPPAPAHQMGHVLCRWLAPQCQGVPSPATCFCRSHSGLLVFSQIRCPTRTRTLLAPQSR